MVAASRCGLRLLLIVVALAGAVVASPAHTARAAPSLVLTPDRAPCAGRVTIRGADLPPGQAVALVARQIVPPSDAGRGVVELNAGVDGAFTLDLSVSKLVGECSTNQPPADGTVYAIAVTPGGKGDGTVYARATLTIGASSAPGPPNEPTLALAPNQAPCETAVTARGAGFPAGATVEVTLPSDPQAGPTGIRPSPPVAVAADGTFALDVAPCVAGLPGADVAGTHYRVAAATVTADPLARPDAYAAATFTVGPVAQRPVPTIVLSPDRGACNSPIVVSGADWRPGTVLALSAFPVGSDSGAIFARVTVGADGTFALPVEMRLVTYCTAARPEPIGARYRLSAGPEPRGDQGGDFAGTVYTVDTERLTERCFAATGVCVRDPFLEAWEFRGLAINGYPLAAPRRETLEDGNEYLVQYFERVRLEHHPEHAAPYDVLLGQFGRRILASVPDAPTAPAPPRDGFVHFPETGHNVGPAFILFWQFNGGLAQFGFPLTEPFEERLEDGTVRTVQYFERARFELHPENAGTPYEVQLGQFGRRILAEGSR